MLIKTKWKLHYWANMSSISLSLFYEEDTKKKSGKLLV